MLNMYIDESGSVHPTSKNFSRYFIIGIVIPKNPLKLKRVYKTFVRKNFKILKELDKENKMFDNNGKFIELKGSSMNKPMKLNFMDFFCQNNALEVRYIILDNNNLEETATTTVVNVNASFNNSSSKIDSKTNKIENNIQNRNVKNTQNMQNTKPNSLSTKSDTTSKTKDTENIGVRETRQLKPRNNLLRDLIQILILKKLLEENKLPTRPPKPPVNPIPPRPPIRPRDYVDYYKF